MESKWVPQPRRQTDTHTHRHTHTQGCGRTCGVAGVCVERQDFDKLVVGAGGQQLAALAPGHAVDGALVVLVPPEANHGLLDRPARVAAGGRADGRAGGRADGRTHTHTHTQLVYVCSVDFYREG